jgi:hypothetical protein
MLMTIKPVYLTLLTGLFKCTSVTLVGQNLHAMPYRRGEEQRKRIFAIRNYRHLRIVKFEQSGNFTGR